ncbi:proteasome (prosome, macropain) 26S subunit, nonATPase, 6, putative [Acanthamoeba castellanii str. Neff]|jgi:26S proteasome regulatory subunit N7|uniref:Proteasome (Prosome, macropain) 26S subunit, nonATPase, 6, putative n=1 Tax=Acanthamoeba castellanii (strain ATCC 30010 / Neff) TaxID=1257118 RepID=L8HJG4_ACACF|nr:proteasome (prosome, macropain) 26S subunit, nonATPase, 6, putative [Acanthamoeba castellanii str. Neff]ELR25340.1 proteasome (prosome, macropain) 26S subunit, nonATPase, 6, putative [Acanthamoeba castellanii str. Neff]
MATLSITEEEASMPKNPDLELAQKRFLLTLNDEIVPPEEKQTIKDELFEAVKKDNMLPFYQALCEQFKWKVDTALVETMKAEIEKKVKELNDTIADAEENLGESEVREGFLARADFYCRIGDKEKAIQAFRETTEKTVGLGQKLDILFTLIRMGFFWNDNDLVTRNIEKAKSMIEQGGDWDRRNRLKVYEALYNASIRKFSEAATLFLEGLATFTSYELCTYNHFIFYAILMSAVSIDRVNLKKKVTDAPEVLAVIRDPELSRVGDLINSIYNSEYATFFQSLAEVTDRVKRDRYLAVHVRYYCREMRIKAYAQLLDSYRSVRLDSMAKAFGVTEEFLDRELSRFITTGRLHCKIDKVDGIVETTRPDSKNAQYQEMLKCGDALLNRVSKLSRIINL